MTLSEKIKEFYFDHREDEDKSWNLFYNKITSAFPEYKFQFLIDSKAIIIKCVESKDSIHYFKCTYDPPYGIMEIDER